LRTDHSGAFYTNALKLKQMKQYGETGSPSEYKEDHFIPLELGGAPKDPKNLCRPYGTVAGALAGSSQNRVPRSPLRR
jgi:hypothetical protein